jgi:hypothetical protein
MQIDSLLWYQYAREGVCECGGKSSHFQAEGKVVQKGRPTGVMEALVFNVIEVEQLAIEWILS